MIVRLISGIVQPAKGSLLLDGRDLSALTPSELNSHRHLTGIVNKQGGLISNLKVWENVLLPLEYWGHEITEDLQSTAIAHLEALGFTGNLMTLPAHLGLHEKRIVALVRAFITNPRIIVYGDCFSGESLPHLPLFSKYTGEFHGNRNDRISIYISTTSETASELSPDTVIDLHDLIKEQRTS